MVTRKKNCVLLCVFLFCLSSYAATTIKNVTLPSNYVIYNPNTDNTCKEKLPECLDAADVSDDGSVNLADAVAMLNYLFAGGEPLAEPFLKCGTDPSPDQLGCKVFVCSG